jgi:hypothetical protein
MRSSAQATETFIAGKELIKQPNNNPVNTQVMMAADRRLLSKFFIANDVN